jgi:hypothetical protein
MPIYIAIVLLPWLSSGLALEDKWPWYVQAEGRPLNIAHRGLAGFFP